MDRGVHILDDILGTRWRYRLHIDVFGLLQPFYKVLLFPSVGNPGSLSCTRGGLLLWFFLLNNIADGVEWGVDVWNF